MSVQSPRARCLACGEWLHSGGIMCDGCHRRCEERLERKKNPPPPESEEDDNG